MIPNKMILKNKSITLGEFEVSLLYLGSRQKIARQVCSEPECGVLITGKGKTGKCKKHSVKDIQKKRWGKNNAQ